MNTSRTSPGEILLISRPEVDELLTPAACLDRCMETFRWVGEGRVEQVNPVNLFVPDAESAVGVVEAFPAMIRPLERAALKWLSFYRGNPDRALPAISALDLLTDTETGMPLALVDGTSVTNMRTGAHAAVGAKFLARSDSRTVALVGSGNEARTHLRHLAEIFPIETAVVFARRRQHVDRFCAEMSSETGIDVRPASSPEEAVAVADIVCVVTTSPEPVVMEPWVRPGTHVCAATGFVDVDKTCATAFDKWVVGWYGRDLDWIEGEEVGKLGGLSEGDLMRSDIHADLATEILPGLRPGREDESERTIMTHLGMPALDAAVASLVYDLALEAGAGTWLEVF